MRRALLFAALLAGVLLTVSQVASGSTSSNTIYNSFVKPKPGNLPSQAFEAQSASQFGDEVTFAGTNRKLKAVKLQLSSWGCQSGHWFSGDCHTNHGATFAQPITFNIYQPPSSGNGVGALIASKTQTFNVRYRPSASKKCTGPDAGEWYKSGVGCFNGLAVNVKFDFSEMGVTLPDTVVYGISYNTTHFGPAPIGEGAPCYTSSGGCPYDSLNVLLGSSVTVGTKPHPGTTYLSSSWSGAYCDGGAAGVSTFRLDSPTNACWGSLVPAVQFTASKR
ncbi:MAG: hypothetical protein ACXVFF_05595 [Gaiellaceae bacterium]